MTEHDCNIVVNPNKINDTYCVYEHYWINPDPNAEQPMVLVFVSAEKLSDVYMLRQGRRNSEWQRLFGSTDTNLLVRVIMTCETEVEAHNKAINHIRTFNPIPQCNLKGFNLTQASRKLICSNGQKYENQTDAARKLGLTQSSISKHLLNGRPKHVGGFTFTYDDGL